MAKNEPSAFAVAAQAVLDEYGDNPEACSEKIKALAKVFADQSPKGKGSKAAKKDGYKRGAIGSKEVPAIKEYLSEHNGDYAGASKKFRRKPETLEATFTPTGKLKTEKG